MRYSHTEIRGARSVKNVYGLPPSLPAWALRGPPGPDLLFYATEFLLLALSSPCLPQTQLWRLPQILKRIPYTYIIRTYIYTRYKNPPFPLPVCMHSARGAWYRPPRVERSRISDVPPCLTSYIRIYQSKAHRNQKIFCPYLYIPRCTTLIRTTLGR